jgi:hypothetical protein
MGKVVSTVCFMCRGVAASVTRKRDTARSKPELGKPKETERGDLRFLAQSNALRQRAEAALANKAVENGVFFNGEED